MDKIRIWFIKYQFEINWFLIGSMFQTGICDFSKGEFLECLFDFGIALLLYSLNRK